MRKLVVLVLTVLSPLAGCGGSGGVNVDSKDSALAADSAEVASETSAFAAITAEPLGLDVRTSVEAAAKARANATKLFQDPGCVTAALDLGLQTKVVYTLNNCTGPFGLVKATGKVAATYTVTGQSAQIQIASIDALKVNTGTLVLAANVTVEDVANPRRVTVQSTTSATTGGGRALTHAGSYTISWDASTCLGLDGQFATSEGGRQLATVIAGYRRCMSQCPEKGTITVTYMDTAGGARVVQVTYSGQASAQVKLTTPAGQASATVVLTCG